MANRRPTVAKWNQVPLSCSHLFDNVPMHRTKAAVFHSWPFLYVLGGRSGHVGCRDFWRFNLKNDQWEEIVLKNQPLLENHAACWYNNCLYLFGGQFTRDVCMMVWERGQQNFTEAKASGSTSRGQRSPPNLRGHSLIALDGYLYLFGGWADMTGASDQMWKFDPVTFEWKLMQMIRGPSARHGHSAVVYGQSVWIFGGMRNFDVLSDLWKIEFDNASALVKCTEIKCRYGPAARYGHSACVAGQRMYIFCGYDADGTAMDSFWCFDFIDKSWHSISTDPNTQWPQAPMFHRCVTIERSQHQQSSPDYDETITLTTPFQRGGTMSRSGDSGYSSTNGRNTESIASSSDHTKSMDDSHITKSFKGSLIAHSVQFLEPVAADNHGYSDEDELAVIHEGHSHEEDDPGFVLPGSVIGYYEEELAHRKSTAKSISNRSKLGSGANTSTTSCVEMKTLSSNWVTPVEIFDQTRLNGDTSIRSMEPVIKLTESIPNKSRSTSICLVASSNMDNASKASKYLTVWSCQLDDDSFDN